LLGVVDPPALSFEFGSLKQIRVAIPSETIAMLGWREEKKRFMRRGKADRTAGGDWYAEA